MDILANNKKAFHNYHIEDKYEAGIVLEGCEVKSIRKRKLVLKDSFARMIKGELWLFNCYITPYTEQNTHFPPKPERDRKLLLNQYELAKIEKLITQKGYSAIPLKMYIKKQYIKVQIGLGLPKKTHDKRADLKNKQSKREMERGMKFSKR